MIPPYQLWDHPADPVTEGPAQWLSPSLPAPKGLSVSGGTGHYSISPYNSQVNGKIERTQWLYIEAIWKVLQGEMNQWPSWLGYALWADRMTVKKNTGYSPYYLLYGQHLLIPFDVINITFHVLKWPKVPNMAGLLVLCMQQLEQWNILLLEAQEKSFLSRAKAVDAYNQCHMGRMKCCCRR